MSVYPSPNFYFGFDDLVQNSNFVKWLPTISLYLYLDFQSFFLSYFLSFFFYLFFFAFFVSFVSFFLAFSIFPYTVVGCCQGTLKSCESRLQI